MYVTIGAEAVLCPVCSQVGLWLLTCKVPNIIKCAFVGFKVLLTVLQLVLLYHRQACDSTLPAT